MEKAAASCVIRVVEDTAALSMEKASCILV